MFPGNSGATEKAARRPIFHAARGIHHPRNPGVAGWGNVEGHDGEWERHFGSAVPDVVVLFLRIDSGSGLVDQHRPGLQTGAAPDGRHASVAHWVRSFRSVRLRLRAGAETNVSRYFAGIYGDA